MSRDETLDMFAAHAMAALMARWDGATETFRAIPTVAYEMAYEMEMERQACIDNRG